MNTFNDTRAHATLDPRFVITVIVLWMAIIVATMVSLGISDSEFFRFGPSPNVMFFKLTVDNWNVWSYVCVYAIVNQLIQTYGLETITPWMLCNIQNRDRQTLPFNRWIVQVVIQFWYVYLWVGRIIGIQILLMQFDFLLIVLVCDLVATFVTTELYIREKSKRMANEILVQHYDVAHNADFHRMYGSI